MPLNVMKSETLEEAQERLREQTRLEREGLEAVTEGQLTPFSASVVDPLHSDLQDEMHERIDAERVAPTMQDRPDQNSVDWAMKASQNDPDASLGEDEGRRSSSRRGSKSRKSAKKPDGE